MAKIIGIGGPKGSGKSTVASAMATMLGDEVSRFSFADPMKAMIATMMDYAGVNDPWKQISDPELKEQPINVLCGASYRTLAQPLGTEWGRDMIHPDLWVSICQHRIIASDDDYIIIDDVRFENEVEMIRANEGLVVKLQRDGTATNDTHVSEAGIDAPVVLNNADAEDAAMAILRMMDR